MVKTQKNFQDGNEIYSIWRGIGWQRKWQNGTVRNKADHVTATINMIDAAKTEF